MSHMSDDHIDVSQPAVRVQIDDAGNPTVCLDEKFAAANYGCSSCENNTDTTGTCGNDY